MGPSDTEKPKIRISAKEVLGDIRSGLDDDGFMEKYDLTYRQLQGLFRKMIKAGLITPMALARRLCVTRSQVTDVLTQAERAMKELE